MYQKLDLFLSSGERWEIPALLGPIERVNLNHWTMDKFQKPSNSECNTLLEEPFSFYSRSYVQVASLIQVT
jgi:hypothetical protein